MKLKSQIGWLVGIVRWGLTSLLWFLSMPIGSLASFLGILLEFAQELALALIDMPDDVANQICNAFPSDQPEKKDDPYWETTGEGLSVAAHDVIYLWDPPTRGETHTRLGLWGHHEPLNLPEPRMERQRKHV